MFTGIIQHVGTVVRTEATQAGRRLLLDIGPLAQNLRLGDSVAVNGACLTASSFGQGLVGFDVIHETLRRTTLGQLTAQSRVNLERALQLGDRLDGHMVQGHVDGQARVDRIDRSGGEWVVHFTAEKTLTDEMVSKGSVALDGVSLTLAGVATGQFSVALIPTTLAKTTLAEVRPGQSINVETDILGKYVRRFVSGMAGQGGDESGLTLEKLRQAGFE